MCSGGSPGERQMAAGSGNVGRGWNACLVPAPLAESVLGTRHHAERPACGSQAPPQSLCAGSFSSSRGGCGQEPSRRVGSAHLLLGRPKSSLGIFPIRCCRKDQMDLSGQLWTAQHWLCLYQGGQTLPIKSPRVNIFSCLALQALP